MVWKKMEQNIESRQSTDSTLNYVIQFPEKLKWRTDRMNHIVALELQEEREREKRAKQFATV